MLELLLTIIRGKATNMLIYGLESGLRSGLRYRLRPSVAKISLLLLAVFTLSFVTSCASSKERRLSDEKYYDNGARFMAKKNYQSALETFNSIKTLYPLSPYIQSVELESISAHYGLGEYEEAEVLAQRFISFYPDAQQKDFAYYMLGRSQYATGTILLDRFDRRDLNGAKNSFVSFQQLTSLFPDSPYVVEGRAHMRHIRNIIAEDELQSASFYFSRYSYVAAINRCRNIIENFPHTPSVEGALRLMVNSYKRLGLEAQAQLTMQTLEDNFSTN